jgi:hypothetical protein
MILIFRRTGQRGYAVEAKRQSFPDLEMNPAPGYDALMPHDLMHLVVEAQLGLTRGVFGQLAAGGDAGTFHSIFDPKVPTRTAARSRHRLALPSFMAKWMWQRRQLSLTLAKSVKAFTKLGRRPGSGRNGSRISRELNT